MTTTLEPLMQELTLPNGKRAYMRSLEAADRTTVEDLFRRLSPQAKRSRFLRSVNILSASMLTHLVDSVDGVNHIALVVFVEEPSGYEPVGIGRIARYDDNFHAADIAVTVRDEWHGQGVGTLLANAVVAARPAGVETLVTGMLGDNTASLRILSKFGTVHTVMESPGVLTARVELI